MKYLSLFSGIGGFELGIQQAYELHNRKKQQKRDTQMRDCNDNSDELECQPVPICCGFSEIDKYAIQIYEKHFPDHKNYGDITKISPKDIADHDLLVGGFPCQAFSIAGKRGGFKDTRGTLFFEICKIIREKQPRLLLLENVKGLLSHDKGATFYTIISTLDELGYDCQWQVLNSKNHGVPQNRERVFIIGHLRGTSRPEVFPFGSNDGEDTETRKDEPQGQEVSGIATRHLGRNGGLKSDIASTMQVAETPHIVTGNDLNDVVSYTNGKESKLGDRALESKEKLRKKDGDMFGVQGEKEDGYTPQERGLARQQGGELGGDVPKLPLSATQSNKDMQAGGLSDKEEEIRLLRKTQSKVQEVGQSENDKTQSVLRGSRIRRLTCVECERLQGFPDGWTEGVSDTQRYKCLGNAVTVNVIQDIMEKLLITN